ncbi:MAG: type II secretion system F family protein, partial [Burkholderiaceae bacterium]
AKRSAKKERWNKTARWMSPAAKIGAGNEEQIKTIRTRLTMAGYRSDAATTIFFAARVLLAVVLPLAVLTGLILAEQELTTTETIFVMLAGAVVGYIGPRMWLNYVVERRQRDIFEAFPEAVDMMVVCVEAGLAMDAAIARTAKELEIRSPALAEELHLVGLEIRVGATRERAMRGLASRTGVEEVSSFVAMMLQADKFGTSVADSLRVQSDALRVKRRQRAEETAAKLPVKLLFPLILCIFPSMLLVLVGPSAIQMIRILFPAMAGG